MGFPRWMRPKHAEAVQDAGKGWINRDFYRDGTGAFALRNTRIDPMMLSVRQG
jgi:hypothetical protein